MAKKSKLILGLSIAGGGAVVAGGIAAAVVLTLPDSSSASSEATAVQTIKASAADYNSTPVEGESYQYQGDKAADPDGIDVVTKANADAVVYAPNLAFSLAKAKSKLPSLSDGKSYLNRPIVRVVYQDENIKDALVWNKVVVTKDGTKAVLQYPTQSEQNVQNGDRLVVSYPVINADLSSSADSYEVSFLLTKTVNPDQGTDKVVHSSASVIGELADFYGLLSMTNGSLPPTGTSYSGWKHTDKDVVKMADGGTKEYKPGVFVKGGDTIWVTYVNVKSDQSSDLLPYYCQVGYSVYDSGVSLSQFSSGVIGLFKQYPAKPAGGKLTSAELELSAQRELENVNYLWSFAKKTTTGTTDNQTANQKPADLTDLKVNDVVTVTYTGTPSVYNINKSLNVSFQVVYLVVDNVAPTRADISYDDGQLLPEEISQIDNPFVWSDHVWNGQKQVIWENESQAYKVGAKGKVVFTVDIKTGYTGQSYKVSHSFTVADPTQKARFVVSDQTTWIEGVSAKDNAALPLVPGYTQYRLFARTFLPSSATASTSPVNVLDNPLAVKSEGVVTSKYMVSGEGLNDYSITVNSYTREATLSGANYQVDGYALVLPGETFLDSFRLPSLGSAYEDFWTPVRYYKEDNGNVLHLIKKEDVAALTAKDRLVVEYTASSKDGTRLPYVYRLHLAMNAEDATTRLDGKSDFWNALAAAQYQSPRYTIEDKVVWQKGVTLNDSATIPVDADYTQSTLIKRRFYKQPPGSSPYDDTIDVFANPLLVTEPGYVYSTYAVTASQKETYTVVVISTVV